MLRVKFLASATSFLRSSLASCLVTGEIGSFSVAFCSVTGGLGFFLDSCGTVNSIFASSDIGTDDDPLPTELPN